MEYTELQEKMAQRIFDIGFVKKAHFQIEDCRYMVRSFYDLAEPKFAINTDLYEALKGLVDDWVISNGKRVGDSTMRTVYKALSKAGGRDDT